MTIPDPSAAHAALRAGRDAEARALLAGWPGHDGADEGVLAAGLATLHRAEAASDALRSGRVGDLVREAEAAGAALPAELPWLVFHVGSIHQAAYRFTGRPALRERTLELLGTCADRLDLPSLAVAARGLMANVHMMHGAFDRSLALADAAVELAAASDLADDAAAAMAWQFRGYVLFERDRLDEAAGALERAWALASHRAGVASGVARVMARVCDARGDAAGVSRWLERLDAVVSEPMTLRNREWLAAVRVGHALGPGELRAVEAWLDGYDYRPETVASWADEAVLAQLHELERALTLLEATSQWTPILALAPRVSAAAGAERPWFSVRALTTEAVALEAEGRRDAADDRWTRAVALARRGGFVRAFLEGSASRETLRRRHGGNGSGPEPDAPALTPAQLDVLRQVAAGASNKAAARALGVSVNTVRTHLRAVYERLGAGSRTHAVARARAIGLLP